MADGSNDAYVMTRCKRCQHFELLPCDSFEEDPRPRNCDRVHCMSRRSCAAITWGNALVYLNTKKMIKPHKAAKIDIEIVLINRGYFALAHNSNCKLCALAAPFEEEIGDKIRVQMVPLEI